MDYITILTALGYIILSLILAKIVISIIIGKIILKATKKTKTELDDLIINTIKWPVYYGIILGGLYFAIKLVFPQFSETVDMSIVTLSIIFGVWIVIKISDFVVKSYAIRMEKKKKVKLDEEVLNLIQRLSKIFILVIGLLIILGQAGIEITPLLAGLGIAGLAIALALQDTLSNFFSGIYLIFDKPFKVGDRIQVDGEFGEIIDVGLRTVRIRGLDNTLITIPNSLMAKTKIVNLSAPDLRIRVKLPIGVSYGSNVEKVKKVLLDIAKKEKNVLKEPKPIIRFKEFGDFSLNFYILFWVDDVRNKWSVIDKINSKIDSEFKKNKIQIPFPTRTVYLKK